MTKEHVLAVLSKSEQNEERLHSALLLAFTQAVYRILAGTCIPAPLYRLTFDEETNNLTLQEPFGTSVVPSRETLDIRALDIVVISNLRDIPVLFEGETGVGKTYVSHCYLRTVFPKDSYITLRLSGNTFLNNIFQPFLEGSVKNGMPITKIKEEAVDKIGGMFVDEINRGDPQNVLQLLDNELYNAGQFRKLGIPITKLIDGMPEASGKRKSLAILTAQNPASVNDAKFTSTMELDAAVDNRLLRVNYGNGANSAGTTLWLEDKGRRNHERFLKALTNYVSRYLGADEEELLPLIQRDWLSLYAYITNTERTDKTLLYSGLELADLLVCVLGGALCEKFAYERRVIFEWAKKLRAKGYDLPDQDKLVNFKVKETQRVKTLEGLIDTFKVDVIFRDIVQIKKLADLLATLRTLIEACSADDPVATYENSNLSVTVKEVAGAATLMARNKQRFGSEPPTAAINAVLLQYVDTVELLQKRLQYSTETFSPEDGGTGVKNLVLMKAMQETLAEQKTSSYLVERLLHYTFATLLQLSAHTEEIRNMTLVRSSADLLTLCGFLTDYEEESTKVLQEAKDAYDATYGLVSLYFTLRNERAMTMPDIYQHRILRTLGG